MDPFQREILEIIAAHDGQQSWYQIDRALGNFSPNRERNLSLLQGLMQVPRRLEDDGMISTQAGHLSSQPVDSIAAPGKRVIDKAFQGHEVG